MPPRIDLPDDLRNVPFSVRAAAERGVGRGRLAGPDLDRPFRGAREPVAPPTAGYDDAVARRRCRSFAPLLHSGQFFGFISAAYLWGCPIRVADPGVVHVCTPAPNRAPRRIGVMGHQVTDATARVESRSGLPVADAATTFLQLARLLTLDELVVAGDHLTHDPFVLDPRDIRPHVRLDDLTARVLAWHGRGRRHALDALELLRPGAESRMETLLRLLLWRAGFPEPEVNPELTGIRRRWIHRADLVYRSRRVIVEYDGDHHRTDTRQYENDIRRFDDFADDGWRVVRVRQRGVLVYPTDTIERVTSALGIGGTNPRR